MAGYDPRDATTSVLPVPDYLAALTGTVKGVRIGLLRSFFMESAGDEQRRAVEQALKTLESLGAAVREVSLEKVALAAGASTAVIAAEAYAYHEPWIKKRPEAYGPDVRERLRLGAFVSGADYVNGQRARAVIRDSVDLALAGLDVLVAPTTPIAATAVDASEARVNGERQPVRPSLIRFTRPFNITGHPAASIPCGFTSDGLPIGLQIVGRPFDEVTVLRVADAYQGATDWHTRRPPLAG
jgi:aspartyl-tRNA(Asn)/glutamyl-tRNA(Gln) amidotransferase subunit A